MSKIEITLKTGIVQNILKVFLQVKLLLNADTYLFITFKITMLCV